jgi:ketosteroid isomerase-like protein
VLSDGIVWDVPGHNSVSGTYHGPGEVGALLMRISHLTNGTFRLRLEAVLGDDGDVAAIVTVRGCRSGTPFSYDAVQVWKVTGEQAVGFKEYVSDPAVVDEIYR